MAVRFKMACKRGGVTNYLLYKWDDPPSNNKKVAGFCLGWISGYTGASQTGFTMVLSHLRGCNTLQKVDINVYQHVCFSIYVLGQHVPYHPCMVYLPTFG